MKKILNTETIMNELRGESPFFPVRQPHPTQQVEHSPALQPDEQPSRRKKEAPLNDTVIPRHHDTVIDTTIPSNHDTSIPVSEEDMIEAVRKAVKQIGKEPATQRLTLEEKNALRAIEFAYAQQGIMTSGNEIIRIGMNFLLKEYQKHGENSILAKVLNRLNS